MVAETPWPGAPKRTPLSYCLQSIPSVRDGEYSAIMPPGSGRAVILPESAASDADQLYKRLQAAVSSRPIGQAGRLKLSAGIAELKAEDDGVSFFERADEALYRAKDAGKGTAVASGGG